MANDKEYPALLDRWGDIFVARDVTTGTMAAGVDQDAALAELGRAVSQRLYTQYGPTAALVEAQDFNVLNEGQA